MKRKRNWTQADKGTRKSNKLFFLTFVEEPLASSFKDYRKPQRSSLLPFLRIQQRFNNCMLNLCALGRIIYQGFCFVWVFNGPAPAVHLGTDHSFSEQRVCGNPFGSLPFPCRDGVINRPLSQFCFIEGDTVQVISLKTFVLEGNYRIVLCLEHSLVNSGVETQVSVAQGTHGDKEDNDSNPIKKRFLPTSPLLLFFSFKNQLKEKRFAHLVITNGNMNYRDAPDWSLSQCP